MPRYRQAFTQYGRPCPLTGGRQAKPFFGAWQQIQRGFRDEMDLDAILAAADTVMNQALLRQLPQPASGQGH